MDQQELDQRRRRYRFLIGLCVVLYVATRIARDYVLDMGSGASAPLPPAIVSTLAFIPLILLIGFGVLMRRSRTIASKLIEPSPEDSARIAASEKLTIPLETALDKLKRDSTLNPSDFGSVVIGLAFMALILSGTYFYARDLQSERLWLFGFVFLCGGILGVLAVLRRMMSARKLKRLYDGAKTPRLVADARGLTIPAIMISYRSKMLTYLLKAQTPTLTVAWSDITAWKIMALPQSLYLQTYAPVYMLTVENLPVSKLKALSLKSDLLSDKDQGDLTAFARRFLKVSIEEFASSSANRKRVRRLLYILLALVVLPYLALLGVLAFGPKQKVDLHREVTYPCEQGMLSFAKANGADPYDAQSLISNDAVAYDYITRYVQAREGYRGIEPQWNYDNYNLVRVFSLPLVFGNYQQQIMLKNPQSPGARLGSDGVREVTVTHIRFLSQQMMDHAQVARRYILTAHITQRQGDVAQSFEQSIHMKAEFIALSLAKMDRCLNVLGFRVLDYESHAAP